MKDCSYCHGLLYEPRSPDHLSEADTKRKVIVDQIAVPAMVFSIYRVVADPRV